MSASVIMAHDYFTQRGGAERVALSLSEALGYAPIYTSFLDRHRTHLSSLSHTIHASPWNRLGVLRTDPRRALPLLPRIWGKMRAEGQVLVASSSGWAHGMGGDFDRRIVYCHTPARWLYRPADYPLPKAARNLSRFSAPMMDALKHWDQVQAERAHVYVANSSAIRDRIRGAYGIEAQVVHPAVVDLSGIEQQAVPSMPSGSYLLCVARLMPYKHVLEIVEAIETRTDLRLVIVGDGPLATQLSSRVTDRVHWFPRVSENQLAWLYAHSKATISASHEDFGLMPVEGFQFGRPAILLRRGGFLETQIEGVTGMFFDEPSPQAISAAIDHFQDETFDAAAIKLHAEQFSFASFARQMSAIVTASVRSP